MLCAVSIIQISFIFLESVHRCIDELNKFISVHFVIFVLIIVSVFVNVVIDNNVSVFQNCTISNDDNNKTVNQQLMRKLFF